MIPTELTAGQQAQVNELAIQYIALLRETADSTEQLLEDGASSLEVGRFLASRMAQLILPLVHVVKIEPCRE